MRFTLIAAISAACFTITACASTDQTETQKLAQNDPVVCVDDPADPENYMIYEKQSTWKEAENRVRTRKTGNQIILGNMVNQNDLRPLYTGPRGAGIR